MLPDHHSLLREIQEEIRILSQLKTLLDQSSPELLKGIPLSADIIEIIDSTHERWAILHQQLLDGELLYPEETSIVSLVVIEELVRKRLEEKRSQNFNEWRNQSLHNLDRILQIEHRHEQAYKPLENCQLEASKLRNEIVALPLERLEEMMAAFEKKMLPYTALLSLVEKAENIDDETWLDMQSIVEKPFGTSLAVAVSRNRLVMSSRQPQALAGYLHPSPALPAAEISAPLDKTADILSRKRLAFSANSNRISLGDEKEAVLKTLKAKKSRLLSLAFLVFTIFMVYGFFTEFTFSKVGYTLKQNDINIYKINSRLPNGENYLSIAIKQRDLSRVKLLLENGANANATDKDGNPVIHIAVSLDWREAADLLIKHGANISIENEQGDTPLEFALNLGYFDVATLFISDKNLSTLTKPIDIKDIKSKKNPFSLKK